jgi:hypothetical protein
LTVDLRQLRLNLHDFYDFSNKTVLFVGAGGRQLFDVAVKAKRIVAMDQDDDALKELKAHIAACNPPAPVEVIVSRFTDFVSSGDVVYFEFCLHEMHDPYRALTYARGLSPDIVVFDHLPGSVWSFYAAEEQSVRRSMDAMQRFGIRRHATFSIEQQFKTNAELDTKLSAQGTVATRRAQRFTGATDIVIPMDYQLALL